MSEPKRVLVLDDEPDVAELIVTVAQRLGYDAAAAATAAEFEERFHERRPDVIFLDLLMPCKNGAAMVDWLIARQCRARVVMISGRRPAAADELCRRGVAGGFRAMTFLDKPFELQQLRACLADGPAS